MAASASVKRREKLFLGTLEQFTFDFGGSAEDIPTLPDDAQQEEGGPSTSLDGSGLFVPSASAGGSTVLSLEEVKALAEVSLDVGSSLLELPRSAPSMQLALAQYKDHLNKGLNAVREQYKEKKQRERERQQKKRARQP